MYLNQEQQDRNVNVLVYGTTGTGKTALGVSAPDPVILLSERQGFETVRDHARRLGKPMPPTFWIQNREQLAHAVHCLQVEADPIPAMLALLMKDKSESVAKAVATLPYKRPKTVVFDSVTDVMQIIWDGVVEQSPLKKAKDGLPDTSMRHWGAMSTRGKAFIRQCRDLPYNVLFLALLDDREVGEEDERSRVIQPMLPMRGLPSMLAAACNAVGIARVRAVRKKDEQTEMQHTIQFAGPDYMMTKPLRPLRDVEAPNMSQWLDRLSNETDKTDTDKKED